MKCKSCGQEVPAGSEFCPNCGKDVLPRCKSCGKVLLKGARYCTNCGQKLDSWINGGKEKVKSSISSAKNALRSISVNERLLGVVKYSFVFIVCLLVFVFSFTGAIKYDGNLAYQMLATDRYVSYNYENADFDITSIDIIKFMVSSGRHYEMGGSIEEEEYSISIRDDNDKIEKLKKKSDNSYVKLLSEVSDLEFSYFGKAEFSDSARMALHDAFVDMIEYRLSLEENVNELSSMNLVQLYTASILLLINIFVSAIIMVVSLVQLSRVLLAIRKGGSINLENKMDCLLPLLIALPVAILLSLNPLGKYISLSGTIIATLVLASLAFLFSLIIRWVSLVKKHGSIKSVIPSVLLIVFSTIIIGCCFAPLYNANAEVAGYDLSTNLFSNSFLSMYISENDESEYRELFHKTTYSFIDIIYKEDRELIFSPTIRSELETLKNASNVYYYIENDSQALNEECSDVLLYSCMIDLGVDGASAMSSGYFMLVFAVLFAFALLCFIPLDKNVGKIGMISLCLIMLIVALILSFVVTISVNNRMNILATDTFRLNLDGGVISATIFAIVALIISAIPMSKWVGRKEESKEAPYGNPSREPRRSGVYPSSGGYKGYVLDDLEEDDDVEDVILDEIPLEEIE